MKDLKDEWKRQATGWETTLSYKPGYAHHREGRTLTVPFWQGAGFIDKQKSHRLGRGVVPLEPTAAGVLSCLLSDATSYDQARSFEDWCAELGMDSDSRRAKETYDQIAEQSKQTKHFLGDLFDELAAAEH